MLFFCYSFGYLPRDRYCLHVCVILANFSPARWISDFVCERFVGRDEMTETIATTWKHSTRRVLPTRDGVHVTYRARHASSRPPPRLIPPSIAQGAP